MKIAAWSGPRNLSTAMMYSFAARGDCAVVDEPFYSAYLQATGLDHPMRDRILAAQPTYPDAVVKEISGSIPGEMPHLYLKLMTHHMLDGFPLDWMAGMKHVFLIRHPARVVASYAAKREAPDLSDLGFVQQVALFDRVSESATPVVIDSADIRRDPEEMLRALCDAVGLDFTPAMLSWEQGGIPEDGVWASHWYGAVHRSTGFAGAEGPLPELTGAYADLAEAAMPYYRRLAAIRLRGS